MMLGMFCRVFICTCVCACIWNSTYVIRQKERTQTQGTEVLLAKGYDKHWRKVEGEVLAMCRLMYTATAIQCSQGYGIGIEM